MVTIKKSAATDMLHKTLDGGWKIVEKLEHPPERSGGRFSIGYIGHDESGRRAFIKVIDYTQAMNSADPTAALLEAASGYAFERDLCITCTSKYMQHVVVAITHGTHRADNGEAVPYIIFELADGDIRRHLALMEQADTAWRLRVLHHMSVGLQQLHTAGIAHQDLKPANVLVFSKEIAKIADLGCASLQGKTAPRDHYRFPGDQRYAPPEVHYNYVDPEWNRRRQGADLYMLGNMLCFVFSNITMTGKLYDALPVEYHPGVWHGNYRDVLPFIRRAHDASVIEIAADFPTPYREDLKTALMQLCEPDLTLRGARDVLRNGSSTLSLERFVSLFNLLASRAELAKSS